MERDLDPGTEYTVYMTASTSSGEGNRSDSITINTPAKGEYRSVNLRTFALIVCAQRCCAGNATVMSRITSRISYD